MPRKPSFTKKNEVAWGRKKKKAMLGDIMLKEGEGGWSLVRSDCRSSPTAASILGYSSTHPGTMSEVRSLSGQSNGESWRKDNLKLPIHHFAAFLTLWSPKEPTSDDYSPADKSWSPTTDLKRSEGHKGLGCVCDPIYYLQQVSKFCNLKTICLGFKM